MADRDRYQSPWRDIYSDYDEEPPRPAVSPGKLPATARLASHITQVVFQTPAVDSGAVVQRKGGGKAAAEQVRSLAEAGTEGTGSSLPFFDQISRSFGRHDVSDVQTFSGDRAEKASAAMGAEAYATGDKVAFGGAPDLHTAAHEAAHVVQQRAGVSLEGGVGKDGDAHERHADAVAELVVRGESAEPLLDEYGGRATAVGAQSQMKRTLRRSPVWDVQMKGTEHVGGDASEGDVIEDYTPVDTGLPGAKPRQVAPGDDGYSELMLQDVEQSDLMLQELGKGQMLPPVTANLSYVQKAIDWQAKIVGRFKEEEDNTSLLTGHPGGQLIKDYSGRQGREEGRLQLLYTQRSEISQKCNGYNQWIPMPNRAITELEGLELMKQNVGVSDDEAMIAKLREGVANAKKLMALAKTKYKNDPDFAAASKAVPKASDSVESKSKDAKLQIDTVNTCYKGFQSAMAKIESGAENKKGDDDKKRLGEIKAIKAAIRSAASAVDSGMAGLAGAPGKLNDLLNKSTSLKAQWKGEQTADAKLNDAWTQENEKQGLKVPPPSPAQGGATYDVPTGPAGAGGAVGTVVGAAADIYYAKEIQQININLNTIAAKCGQLKSLGEKLDIAKDIEEFKNATAKLSKMLNDLKTAINDRKKAYREFGDALDKLARKYGAEVGIHLGQNKEMFATIFTMSGQIRSAVGLAEQATGAQGDLKAPALKSWFRQMKQARAGAPYQAHLGMGPETEAISSMVSAAQSWDKTQQGTTKYKRLDTEIMALMRELGGQGAGVF